MNKKLTSILHDRRYVVAALVSALTLVIYLPSLRNDFVNWDDYNYVFGNIRSLNWDFFRWAFSNTAGYWHPLVWISHAVDYAIWGLNPVGHHLTSIVLHAINTFMVVCLIVKLLEAANTPLLTGSVGNGSVPFLSEQTILIAGGVTGILFGLHPLQVESVVWIAERKNLIYSLFFIWSTMFYVGYVNGLERKKVQRPFYLNGRYLLSLVFFVLSLSSKPMAVTLPAVLLLLDWYPFRRVSSSRNLAALFLEKAPFIAFSFIVSVVTVISQKTAGAMELTESVPLSGRVLVAFRALMMYLWKIIVPVHLTPLYPYPHNISFLLPEYLAAIVLVCGITAACILIVRKRPFWSCVWVYYVVTLLPALGIIQVGGQSMADRFAYLPSIGPFLITGLGVALVWTKTASLKKQGQYVKLFMAAAVILLVISLSYATVMQIRVWNNSMSLWNYVIEKEPLYNPMAYNSRGLAFFLDKREFDRAIEDYSDAIAQKPSSAEYYVNRGVAFCEKGDFDRSLADLNKAISLKPDEYMAYNNRGNVFYRKGDLDRAMEDFNKAMSLNPAGDLAYNNRGNVFYRKGDIELAIADFDTAINLNSSYTDAYNNRALMFKKKGQFNRAIDDYSKVISLNPRAVETYLDRGDLYIQTGSIELAVKDYQSACNLDSKAGCDKALFPIQTLFPRQTQ